MEIFLADQEFETVHNLHHAIWDMLEEYQVTDTSNVELIDAIMEYVNDQLDIDFDKGVYELWDLVFEYEE